MDQNKQNHHREIKGDEAGNTWFRFSIALQEPSPTPNSKFGRSLLHISFHNACSFANYNFLPFPIIDDDHTSFLFLKLSVCESSTPTLFPIYAHTIHKKGNPFQAIKISLPNTTSCHYKFIYFTILHSIILWSAQSTALCCEI